MNSKRFAALLALVLLMFAAGASAQQEKNPPPPPPRDMEMATVMPLKIQVVFSEYEGERKISSLPYLLNHNATRAQSSRTSLRMGVRVPITTASKEGALQVQYQNVGTDIDCLVQIRAEGVFQLHLELRRSSVYTSEGRLPAGVPGGVPGGAPGKALGDDERWNRSSVGGNPVIREFSGGVDALLRDGQTVQSTMATDPVSGRVLRVDVTLNVIK